MDKTNIEEICEVNNKKYKVITRLAKENLSKEKLVNLIYNYAINELNVGYNGGKNNYGE